MLEKYEKKQHPAKAILRKEFGLKLSTIANFVGRPYDRVSCYLNGILKTPETVDRKLNELIELVRKERAGNA